MSEILTWITGAFTALVALVPGFGSPAEPIYAGYVEADYVYVSAQSPGVIEQLPVAAGDTLAVGDLLFALNNDKYQAAFDAADAGVGAAEATLRNLETGSRQQEIDVVRATLQQARSDLDLAKLNLERSTKLAKTGTVAPAQVDRDKASVTSGTAKVAQLEAQLEVAELPARSAQLDAAEANARLARAQMAQAKADLDERQVAAPVGGIVEQVFFRAGETAGAAQPVIAILPVDATKIRFYIDEPSRAQFHIGDVLRVECDGCASDIEAQVSFIAHDPQTTPPIIYSRDERARLVFMAEARFAEGATLTPGQPVTLEAALAVHHE